MDPGITVKELNQDESRTIAWGSSHLFLMNLFPLFAILLLFNVAVVESTSIASRAFGIAFLLIVPGTVLMALTQVRPKEVSVRLTLVACASMLLLMLLGLLYSLVLPHIGIARPLSRNSAIIGIDVLTLLGLAVQVRHRDPLTYLIGNRIPNRGKITTAGLLALLPLAAAGGAERLNNGHGNGLALAVLVAVGVMVCGLVVYSDRIPRWSISMVLYAASSAILLMTSMRSNYPIGSDIQSEYYVLSETLRNGIWHLPSNGNPYAAMLSITVLPVIISLATHVSGIYLFKVVYPLIFSLFPVLVYVVAVRWFSVRASVIGAIILIVQGFYAADMTGLARQEIALLYFALLIVIAFDESLSLRSRQMVALLAGLGMAVSHYSTAYFASTILLFGFFAQLLFRRSRWRRYRRQVLLSVPVVGGIVGLVILWNVVITRSAQNIFGLAASLQTNGFQFLPGNTGSSSLLNRFLNSDVNPTVSATKIASIAVPYYRAHSRYIHAYPTSITKLFPIKPVTVPVLQRAIPAFYGNLVNDMASVLNELILLLIFIGIVVFLWRERKSIRGQRAEFGFIAVGAIIVLAVLRLSGTVSTLYNAPRGQVQAAPLLSVGLACVFAWMFSGRLLKRVALICVTTICLGILLFSDSGLSGFALGGGAPDTLLNYGDTYESYYYTMADIDSVQWIVGHVAKGQVVYADDYGSVQLDGVANLNSLPLVRTIVPQIVEPGAFVYADSTNVIDKTAYANVNNVYAVYQFPQAFLDRVKDVVFSTGTTEVFR